MNRLLIIVFVFLFVACSDDDSTNIPSGVLTKVEVFYPQNDFRAEYISSFDSSGRILSTQGRSVNSGNTELIYTTTFSYNSNGQIWKSSTVFNDDSIDYTEFVFNNGLISRSLRHRNNGDILKTDYSYNDSNQLINKQHFNAQNELVATTVIAFLADGNIDNTYFEENNGDFKSYTYEFDNKKNPQLTHFRNQEISKVVGNNFNNITKYFYSRNSGTTETNIEYTYNGSDYPLTSREFSSGGTLTAEVTYTYQD
jgi:hypothetical protein